MIASWNKYVYVRYRFLHFLFLFSEVQVAKPGLSHFLSMWFLFESAEALGLRCIFNEDAGTNASYVLCFCVDRQRLRIPHMRGIYLPSWLAGQRLMSCLLGTHILHACVLPKHMFPSSVSTKTECGRSDQVKYSCSQFSAASSWREYVYVARWINLPSPHLA